MMSLQHFQQQKMQDPILSEIPIFESPLQYSPQLYQPQTTIKRLQKSEPYIPQRHNTAQKLLNNRIRRQEIRKQMQEEKQNILNRRKQRDMTVAENIRKREFESHLKMEKHLKGSNIQQAERDKYQEFKQEFAKNQLKLREQKLEACRKKAEKQRMNHAFRVQSKNKERQKQALQKREEQDAWKNCSQFHLGQWKNYQAKIQKKYSNKKISPYNRLYDDFKNKELMFRNTKTYMETRKKQISQRKDNTTQSCKEFMHTQNLQTNHQNDMQKTTIDNFKKLHSPKADYFGIHFSDVLKSTSKDIQKMKNFLFDRAAQSEGVLEEFEAYLFNEIL